MSTNKYMTSDGAGPIDSQGYVQSDWECVSGHSKLQHNGESTLSVGSCWPYPAGREAVPRVAPPLGGRRGVQYRALQSKSKQYLTLQIGGEDGIERGEIHLSPPHAQYSGARPPASPVLRHTAPASTARRSPLAIAGATSPPTRSEPFGTMVGLNFEIAM